MEGARALKLKRTGFKSQLTRLKNHFERITVDNENLSESEIQQLEIRLQKVMPIYELFFDTQLEIETIENSVDETERNDFDNNYCAIVAEVETFLKNVKNENVSSLPAGSGYNILPVAQLENNIKLPVIHLPVFYGHYEQWIEFKDTFIALIHENTSLTDIQKFHYLRAALKDKASHLLSSLTVSSANYEVAWNLLQDRFENKKLIVQNHVSALFDMPVMQKESHTKMRQLLDNVNKNLRALEALGQPVASWDTLIIHMIVSKLDLNSKREWQECDFKNELPNFDHMRQFLKKRCDILESIYKGTGTGSSRQASQIRSNAVVTTNSVPVKTCQFCKSDHYIQTCKDFLKLSVAERHDEVTKLRLCFNCLRRGHSVRECRSARCSLCNKKHNSLLHDEQNGNTTTDKMESSEPSMVTITSHAVNENKENTSYVLLSTALVTIYDKWGKPHKFRAMLDTGSQASFMTENVCRILGTKRNLCSSNIVGINNLKTNVTSKSDVIIHNPYNGFATSVSCMILPQITVKTAKLNLRNLNVPTSVTLADPGFNEGREIDILLGADIVWEIFDAGRMSLGKNKPILIETRLGWVLGGKIEHSNNQVYRSNVCITNECLSKQLETFWNIENINGSDKQFTMDEGFCENHFVRTHTRDNTGRFITEIPFNEKLGSLGSSRQVALDRFIALEKRLNKNPSLKEKYVSFMREYALLGHMEEINNSEGKEYFIPHHAVFKGDKIRVVFDASAKTDTGLSLNEVQYVGPTIQKDLFDILLRFRQYRYVLTADIIKMYRQVLIAPHHRNYQKIFWRENGSDDIKIYNLKTVTYGMSCAPFLAIRSLIELANEIQVSEPVIARIIKDDFYVDDMLTGAETVEELIDIKNKITRVLADGQFNLSKWCSNVKEQSFENDSIGFSGESYESVLGVRWCASNDILHYSVKNVCDRSVPTKRVILASISRVFDPLGILGPITILAKILIQGLWQAGLDWDQPVPEPILSNWLEFQEQLKLIEELKIPRWITTEKPLEVQAHGFSDASERAYGTCVYVRTRNDRGISTTLLCAKSRVAPVKKLSLPRLELCAAVLLAKLMQRIKNNITLSFDKIYLWSDSSVVLHWIKNTSAQWKTFVANRVAIIQTITNTEDWHHVRSGDNPADLISRGVRPKDLITSEFWFRGPDWLSKEYTDWPEDKFFSLENTELIEAKRVNLVTCDEPRIDIFDKFSRFDTLLHVCAYVMRFIHNVKNKNARIIGNLLPAEITQAVDRLVKLAQQDAFKADVEKLKAKGRLSKKSTLLPLNPFIDDKGLLRVGGRLSNSTFSHDKKYPLLLPQRHSFTQLLFKHEHERLLHCGSQALLLAIREKFWPIAGKSTARKVIRNCIRCFKARPQITKYKMGDLPLSRVTPSNRPFTVVGTDFAGPFLLKDRLTRGPKLIKSFVCIFVCFATKAAHLELVADLSTESFIAALKRFVSRRGLCSEIHSDNGTNYVGAKNELGKIYEFLKTEENDIRTYLTKQGINWHFIPARSPHFGGLWEAVVRSMKSHLCKTIGNSHLAFDEFTTILAQVEACLNSRPLSPLSDDPTDLNPLTPGHFLTGGPLHSVPEATLMNARTNTLSRWERTQQITQEFWRRWAHECISQMQARSRWQSGPDKQLRSGDLVLIKQENLATLQWPLGRITQVYPGADGIVRVVDIQTTRGIIKRSTRLVARLPLD